GADRREVAWTPDEFAYDAHTGSPPDPTRVPTVRGPFTTAAVGARGLCFVGGGTPGQQLHGAVLGAFEFKGMNAGSSAAVQGTETVGDVVITRDACSREYDVLAIWPPVRCSTDADCDPLPDPAHGRPTGSGLVPGLSVECNTGPVLGRPDGGGSCFFPNPS